MANSLGPQISATLRRYGLQSLEYWVSWALVHNWSESQIMLELEKTPEFQARFPAIKYRQDRGRSPISVEEYLQYEAQARSLSLMWGYRPSQTEINNWLSEDVSPTELEQRFNIAVQAVYDSDEETRNELSRMFGIGPSQLMRYWLDPKAELPKLQQEFRMAEIAGAARRTGWGQLTTEQASRLQEAGMDRNAATQGFGQLNDMLELFTPLDEFEDIIDADEQVEMLAGNADVAQTVERRAAKRKAEFEGGGEYAAAQEGFATGSAD